MSVPTYVQINAIAGIYRWVEFTFYLCRMQDTRALAAMVEAGIQDAGFPQEPAGLYDPARYILSGSGKRIRPLLTLMAAQLYTDDLQPHVPVALAMEVFHNFTLVHDDIMDQAPVRRGKPTVHVKWDVTTGILSGDVMLIQAYILLAKAPKDSLPDILDMFNTTAREVCEGQQEDMDFERREDVTLDDYLHMIAYKTSVLLGCCLYCGARAAGAPEADARLLYEAGLKLGISFQIQDDILDVYADAADFGKKPGGDIIQNKKTFLTLTALALANDTDAAALRTLLSTPTVNEEEKIAAVKKVYADHDVRSAAELTMATYYEEARVALRQVQVPAERKLQLESLMQAVFLREK